MFDGNACRTNYKGTQLQPFGRVDDFPADPEEQNLWGRVLPNKLRDKIKDRNGKIKRTIGVCYKLFPSDYPKKKRQGVILTFTSYLEIGAKPPPYNLSHIFCSDEIWHSYTLPKEDLKKI